MRADLSRVSGLEHRNKKREKGAELRRDACKFSCFGSVAQRLPDWTAVSYRCSRSPDRNQRGRRLAAFWPFSSFGGGAETPSPTERREKEEEKRSQERKFPQITECFRHTNREYRLMKEEFIQSSPLSWRSKASGCCGCLSHNSNIS